MPVALLKRVVGPFNRFASAESAGGIVLLACTALALGLANSPWSDAYHHVLETTVAVGIPALDLSLHHWINDGLMAVFFLLVGLEIKRELLSGELASAQQAALPIAAAIGGMLVPAALYMSLNLGGAGAAGWGIAMATDIAFALGVITLLGSRVPLAIAVFLTALAIVDDIGAVLVIAFFYTAAISWTALLAAAALMAILVACNYFGVRRIVVYVVLGVALWLAVKASGVHPSTSGVLVAMTVPSGEHSPLARLEHALTDVVAFAIMPVFALANAGVSLRADQLSHLAVPVTLGVVLGLVIGKPVGITAFSWAAVRLGLASGPANGSWRALRGVSWLGGIGFTMSLFIATLAFGSGPLLESAKIGVLVGSLVAGFTGWFALRRALPNVAD